MWGALVGALEGAMGSFVGKALVSLGIGFLTYQSVDTSIAFAKSHFFDSLSGLNSVSVQVFGAMRGGQCVTMLFSALIARLTFKGLAGGVMKSFKLG